jgi:aspartyl-tRNA(Asn)/glutamyl-tRNA(Gln) amidotransferase subunit B
MAQVSDAGAIEAVVRQVVEKNPKQADQLRAGKTAVTGFFVGQVMKETKGSANPQLVNEALKKVLGLA